VEIEPLKIVICGSIGIAGQLIRSVLGCYKAYCSGEQNWFDLTKFLLSLMIGFLVGIMYSFLFNSELTKTNIISVMSFGYAGTDWIEGALTVTKKI